MRAMASSRRGRRGDERLQAQVGIRPAPGEVACQLADDVAPAGGQPQRRVAVQGQAIAAGDRLGGRRAGLGASTVLADRVEDVARQLLGFLDVGLVERVDAQDRARDGGRDLPADELGAEVDRVGELDPDDRMAGRLERRCQRALAAAAIRAGQRDPDERPVGAVRVDRCRSARGRPGRSRRRACRCSRR